LQSNICTKRFYISGSSPIIFIGYALVAHIQNIISIDFATEHIWVRVYIYKYKLIVKSGVGSQMRPTARMRLYLGVVRTLGCRLRIAFFGGPVLLKLKKSSRVWVACFYSIFLFYFRNKHVVSVFLFSFPYVKLHHREFIRLI